MITDSFDDRSPAKINVRKKENAVKVDAAMDSKEIREYESNDPVLTIPYLSVCARYWAGDLDVHDWHISPVYGDLKDIDNVTIFTGTNELFYPDIERFFNKLDKNGSKELIIGEEMFHIYPLFPIKEAEFACRKIIEKVLR